MRYQLIAEPSPDGCPHARTILEGECDCQPDGLLRVIWTPPSGSADSLRERFERAARRAS